MAVRELKQDIYSVGAIDWDRRLFDELKQVDRDVVSYCA